MTFDHEALPDEVEHESDLEPGIFRIDTEALFGHINDREEREEAATEYAMELHGELPDGSIILPMEVEKVADVDDADDLITRNEAKGIADAAAEQAKHETIEEVRHEVLDDFEDALSR